MNLYDFPKYYDLSYSYNMRDELVFLKRVFVEFTNTKHPRLLEPACGTGRLLVPLARAGFDCNGFDLNSNALNYLKKNCSITG
jgi:2-polyprenyl-3-methyl-5-hydroxy-6-metoxy-1,4-benzoquinol methylase